MAMDGEQMRFSTLYAALHPRVLAYALRRVGVDRAREAVDETFLIAWRRRADLPTSPLPWLLVTARNVLADQARRGMRQDAIALEVARCTDAIHGLGADVVALERLTVLRALERLPSRDREALMLMVWEGLNHREAAVVAGCSITAFAVRLHRARRRLAAALDELDSLQASQYGEPTTHRIDAEETQR